MLLFSKKKHNTSNVIGCKKSCTNLAGTVLDKFIMALNWETAPGQEGECSTVQR